MEIALELLSGRSAWEPEQTILDLRTYPGREAPAVLAGNLLYVSEQMELLSALALLELEKRLFRYAIETGADLGYRKGILVGDGEVCLRGPRPLYEEPDRLVLGEGLDAG